MFQHKKTLSLILILLLAAGMLITAATTKKTEYVETTSLIAPKQTIQMWYTDEALTDYLESAAVAFYEKSDIRVILTKVSGLEYIDKIYTQSVKGKDYPDVYITSNDLLEKAYLSGTACEIKDDKLVVSEVNFPETAIRAVTCRDKILGYPFSFETSVLLYNKTYLEDYVTEMANEVATEDSTDEEGTSQDTTNNASTVGDLPLVTLTDAEKEQKVSEILPKSIADILTFSESYNAPESMDAIFRWDVTDIFYNYFFIGSSMNVGGPNGDDKEYIDIYNTNTIKSLQVYQELNQFFAIDTEEINYDLVLEEFMAGKILYTVVTTDAVAKLEKGIADGSFAYKYGMIEIPAVNDTIKSAGLSVTNAVVVNGFSSEKDAANGFAGFLTGEYEDTLYQRTGKVPANKKVVFENKNLNAATQEYAHSVPITKMIEASNFWIQLEIVFTQAWRGEDANTLLKNLSEQIMTQVKGTPYVEDFIYIVPDTPTEYYEYSDNENSNALGNSNTK